MFRFIKQAFIDLLRFSGSLGCITKVSDRTKCISINNEPSLARHTLTNLNPNELHYYPFMVSLERCSGSCNTLDDPFKCNFKCI